METAEITGSKLANFTTLKRPDMKALKTRYQHIKDKQIYMRADDKYPIDVIIGDSLYCKIRTEETKERKGSQ